MIARLLCWLFDHEPVPGVDVARSIRFECARCSRVVPGDLAVRRKRR